MSYKDHLTRYGAPTDSAEIREYIYLVAPETLKTPKDIAFRDGMIAGNIASLEHILDDLREYRQALAARYGALATMPYKHTLKLERCPHWQGHIEYIVTLEKTMEDGTKIDELREVFRGKDRKQAFELFAKIKQERPGIEAIQDIEKRQWER